jgi:putative nucleotidyltransferase with HDIG domain
MQDIYYFPFTPTPPQWYLNWEKIESAFPWIANLAGCPQNPLYHAEGDVLIHTRMVCEALISLSAWRNLPSLERSIVFAAALLHDVGKPATTKLEGDGQLASKGHVRLGTKMARQILWLMSPSVPFQVREEIVALVKYSGLPLWFWDKPNPEKAIIMASQVLRCNLLALLAEADVRGRICQDRQVLLDRIDFFGEFCRENRCFDRPYPFINLYSRFVYSRSENSYADYEAYDDTQLEVVLMSGLPASGKDTWIKNNLPDWHTISLDVLREELEISPDAKQGKVIFTAKERAKEYLRNKQPFVWNATNISKTLRSSLIDLFIGYKGKVRIVYLEAPWSELLARNRHRSARVPERIMEKMFQKLEVPEVIEAHRVDYC